MSLHALFIAAVALTLCACGSDDGMPDQLPSAVLVAHEPEQLEVTTADFDCGPPVGNRSTLDVTLRGMVTDFSSDDPVPGAQLSLFADVALSTSLGESVSDVEGNYEMSLPAGTSDLLHMRGRASGYVDVYGFNQRLALDQPTVTFDGNLITASGLDLLGDLARVPRVPETTVVLADVVDCAGSYLEHAIVTLSSTPGRVTALADAQVVYTVPGKLPVPTSPELRHETADNGTGLVLNVPQSVDHVYVQTWGFLHEAAFAQGRGATA